VSKGFLIGLVLTAVAGWVDAIGYLQLGGFYPSFMSGNTTQLGVALSNAAFTAAALPALLVALFLFGAFAGSMLAFSPNPSRVAAGFLAQGLLLAAAIVLSLAQADGALSLAPLPVAMGLQNVTARRVSQLGVGVTFVTGTLVRLGEALGAVALGQQGNSPLVPALTWCAMLAGAVLGAAAHFATGSLALAVPAVCSVLASALIAAAARSAASTQT
jgi:uncharacterized membrane protein YoaK (UPF0700 family)